MSGKFSILSWKLERKSVHVKGSSLVTTNRRMSNLDEYGTNAFRMGEVVLPVQHPWNRFYLQVMQLCEHITSQLSCQERDPDVSAGHVQKTQLLLEGGYVENLSECR